MIEIYENFVNMSKEEYVKLTFGKYPVFTDDDVCMTHEWYEKITAEYLEKVGDV